MRGAVVKFKAGDVIQDTSYTLERVLAKVTNVFPKRKVILTRRFEDGAFWDEAEWTFDQFNKRSWAKVPPSRAPKGML